MASASVQRDAEERSVAHQDVGSWMDQMKSKSIGSNPTIKKNKHFAAAKKNFGRANSLKSKSMPSKYPGHSSCEANKCKVTITLHNKSIKMPYSATRIVSAKKMH